MFELSVAFIQTGTNGQVCHTVPPVTLYEQPHWTKFIMLYSLIELHSSKQVLKTLQIF